MRLELESREDRPIDLAVVTTNSRNDAPDVARSKVQEVCRLLLGEQRQIIYKKIDSTLQGNLAPEIRAAMDGCECSLAIVAPAFPAMGRTVVGGWLHLGGCQPAEPIHLPTLLRQQGASNVTHFDRALLMRGAAALVEQMEKVSAATRTIVVFDADSEEDLAVIAQAATGIGPRSLMVGSAGLAAEAAEILARKCPRQGAPPAEGAVLEGGCGPVALILGSTNPVTAAQVNYLLANRPAAIIACRRSCLDLAHRALLEKRHLIVDVNLSSENQEALAELVPILAECAVRAVILSGGDTAIRFCFALRATGIKLEREIMLGIPWGRFLGGEADGMAVATKAGGFGTEDSLLVMADFLATRRALS